jgi:hypothetical protein
MAQASMLHPIVKPWPFRGWGLDIIREIHPSSSTGHMFVLVATYYFTKWTEAMPLLNMMHRELIIFVQEYIIHRFGLPQTLIMDQGASFMSHQLKEFTGSLKIKLLNSSPYYAQANGQTKSSNKTFIQIIKKIIEDCPSRWHEVLLEALWAHRTSKHSATKMTPVELVYGQGAVLSAEINLYVHRVIKPDTLSAEDYTELMMEKIDEMPEGRFRALNEIEGGKVRVVNAYKKKVVE